MAADRSRRSQPTDVSIPEVADAVVKVLQHTKQLDLALAGTADIVHGWAESEDLGQKTADKTILQMNQLLLECLLEQNSTGLYNRLTCENILLMVDKNMGGRLSKSQRSTKWVYNGAKLLTYCLQDLRHRLRNGRTYERHAPWLQALLKKMTLECHATGAELRAHHFAGQPTMKR